MSVLGAKLHLGIFIHEAMFSKKETIAWIHIQSSISVVKPLLLAWCIFEILKWKDSGVFFLMINKSISSVSILTLNHKYPISTEHISVLYVLPKVAKYNETKSNMHWTINRCKTFFLNIEIMYIIVSRSKRIFYLFERFTNSS